MAGESRDLDRRAFPRRLAKGTAHCLFEAAQGNRWSKATLVDISQAGIGLLVHERLQAGDWVETKLIPPIGPHGPTCLAEVRWTRRLSDGSCRIGCCLEHRLQYAEMQKLSECVRGRIIC